MTNYLQGHITDAKRYDDHTSPAEMIAWLERFGATGKLDTESGAIVVANPNQTILLEPGQGIAAGPVPERSMVEHEMPFILDHLTETEWAELASEHAGRLDG